MPAILDLKETCKMYTGCKPDIIRIYHENTFGIEVLAECYVHRFGTDHSKKIGQFLCQNATYGAFASSSLYEIVREGEVIASGGGGSDKPSYELLAWQLKELRRLFERYQAADAALAEHEKECEDCYFDQDACLTHKRMAGQCDRYRGCIERILNGEEMK